MLVPGRVLVPGPALAPGRALGRALGLDRFITHAYLTNRYGISLQKPSPRVFELLVERMEEHLLRFGHALPPSEDFELKDDD